MNIFSRFQTPKGLMVSMVGLQVFWLVMRWVFMPAPDWRQLPVHLAVALAFGLLVSLMPATFLSRARRFRDTLVRNQKLSLLTLGMVLLVTGATYAYVRPLEGDERRVFTVATVVAAEGAPTFFREYGQFRWLGPRHPPLPSLLYGFTMRVGGINVLVARSVSLALGIATVLLVYVLGRDLFDAGTGLLAGSFLLSLPLFLHFGATQVENDMPVTFFFSLATLLMVYLIRRPTYRLSGIIGLTVGAGLLSKYTMVLVYPALLGYVATAGAVKRLRRHLGILVLVSGGMLGAWLIYAAHIGVLGVQVEKISQYAGASTTADGVPSLLAGWRMRMRIEALVARLPSAMGVYNIPLFVWGALDLMRRRRQPDLFILTWIAAVFLPLIVILPDKSYFMPAFPAVAIVLAQGVRRIPAAVEQALLLAFAYCCQALYLYYVLDQSARLFVE